MARKAEPRPKSSAIPAADDHVIRLEYDLHALPTAQHKAGLAGLVLQIQAMSPKARSSNKSAPTR